MNSSIDGRFSRIHESWTPDNWNDGYVDKRGYFRVYRPDYPGSWKSGYAKRYWVMYWLVTGYVQKIGDDIHHKNGVKLDDRPNNLQLLSHGEHSRVTQTTPDVYGVCAGCNKDFLIPPGKRGTKKFCSISCYHATPKSQATRDKISASLHIAYQEDRR